MKEGVYYKKIVTYKKNKEWNTGLYIATGIAGFLFGLVFIFAKAEPAWAILFPTLILVIIICLISNFFMTHDRDVKYKRYVIKEAKDK